MLKKIKVKKMENMDMVEPMTMLPSFHVTEKQMPEIKNWEVGNKYKLTIEIEQKSKHEMEMNGKMMTDANFEIVAYSVGKDYDEMDDKEFEKEQAKALSNHK